MTNKLFTLLFFFYCFSLSSLMAYDEITVLNPDRQWQRNQGTIEEASFTIHPKGIYMEIGMYLTVSAKGTQFEQEQGLNLETIIDFSLPEAAIVHDSWLWIGDDIIQAEILDRWTAATIYEEIVGRRQDPSILYKQSATQYQLRIFPLASDSTRKVKITYLMPADISKEHISVSLPIQLLKTSNVPLEKIQIQAFLGENPENQLPQFLQIPDAGFEKISHPNLGIFHKVELPFNEISNLDFALQSPLKEGVFLTQFQNGEDNFYQLAFLPSEVFSITKEIPNKIAVMLDYVSSNSSTQLTSFLSETKLLLKRHLSETDSFNIITSDPANPVLNNTWVSANDASIDAIFDNISTTSLNTYSNLPSLFFHAIQFVQTNPENASLLFASNTDQTRDFNTINLWIGQIISQMGDHLNPVHILDYQDRNFQYHWIGNQNYIGNQYFYNNITRMTAGNYMNVRNTRNFSKTGNELFTSINSLKGQLDIHTTLENGFCYSRYSNSKNNGLLPINQVFTQVGKFQGTFPFIIEANGLIADKLYSGTFAIERNIDLPIEDKTQVIWTGNHINSLAKSELNNADINEIIRYSLDNRVLSLYTAFLALEVAQGGEICESCLDETNVDTEGEGPLILANNEIALDSLIELAASPNPFSEQTSIQVTLGKDIDNNYVRFSIFNVQGKLIRTFESNNINDEKVYQFNWDGTDQNGQSLAKGMYIFNVKTNIGQKNLKLLFIKK